MRAPFDALLILSLIGLSSTLLAAPGIGPSGPWSLKICVLHAPTTWTPCAYLSDQLTLRVENPTWPLAPQPKVVFDRKISAAFAQQLRDQALKAISSIQRLPRSAVQVTQDGTSVIVEFSSGERAQHTGMGVNDAGPDAVKLLGLLHDATGIAF